MGNDLLLLFVGLAGIIAGMAVGIAASRAAWPPKETDGEHVSGKDRRYEEYAVPVYRVFRSEIGWGHSALTFDEDMQEWRLEWSAKGVPQPQWSASMSLKELANHMFGPSHGTHLAKELKEDIRKRSRGMAATQTVEVVEAMR